MQWKLQHVAVAPLEPLYFEVFRFDEEKTGKKTPREKNVAGVQWSNANKTTGCLGHLGDYTYIDLHSYMGIYDKPL